MLVPRRGAAAEIVGLDYDGGRIAIAATSISERLAGRDQI